MAVDGLPVTTYRDDQAKSAEIQEPPEGGEEGEAEEPARHRDGGHGGVETRRVEDEQRGRRRTVSFTRARCTQRRTRRFLHNSTLPYAQRPLFLPFAPPFGMPRRSRTRTRRGVRRNNVHDAQQAPR